MTFGDRLREMSMEDLRNHIDCLGDKGVVEMCETEMARRSDTSKEDKFEKLDENGDGIITRDEFDK